MHFSIKLIRLKSVNSSIPEDYILTRVGSIKVAAADFKVIFKINY